jgi:hypothetical protein
MKFGVTIMPEKLDYSKTPYLDEILKYLPVDADDKEDISTYIQNILNVISVNYEYEQYQFSYFGLHLLYMTYIYCSVWKISQIIPDRYADAVVFAKPYRDRDSDRNKFNFQDIKSVFQYSLVPEKELPKIFKIIGLDDGQISTISGLVDTRNDMAHATGNFEILTGSDFEVKVSTLLGSMKNIHRRMDNQIRKWFNDILIKYNKNEYSDYTNISDIILEKMIGDFKLSVNEILVCNEMSIKDLKKENPSFKTKLDGFKKELKAYCVNNGYLED